MAVIKEDPSLKDNYQLQKEAYAVASFYKDLFGKGSVPSAYTAFLTEPKPPEPPSEEGGEEDEPDPEPEPEPEEEDKPAGEPEAGE